MNKIINHLSFRFTIQDNGRVYPSFWFMPEQICNVVSEWAGEYRSSQDVQTLIGYIRMLNTFALPNKETITCNECHIYMKSEGELTFDCEYVSQKKPVTLPVEDAIYLFEQYAAWLKRYEECLIPGFIPADKLDTWACVPRDQIKEEYLHLLDKKTPE